MVDVVLVSPALSFPNQPISGRPAEVRVLEKVVNLGLLSIASYLDAQGMGIALLDLVGVPDHLHKLEQELVTKRPRVVGISCISCYAYPIVAAYCRLIKAIDPTIYIMGGGQHLSALGATALMEIQELDCVVKGEGEYAAYAIVHKVLHREHPLDVPMTYCRSGERILDNCALPAKQVDLDQLPFLRYDLLPNWADYVPQIEESRGCPWSCHFCTSPFMFQNRVRYKSIPRFIDELASILDLWGLSPSEHRMFFTCDTFGIRETRIRALIDELRRHQIKVSWRTETRVDSPTVNLVEELADVGMHVLDLGIESGSPTMLKRMNKTGGSAIKYLELADRFIRRVGQCPNLYLKINLVFHAGETPETLVETLEYLLSHREHINSVSAGPVMMYPGTELYTNFASYAARYGTSIIRDEYWDQLHTYQVNPSAQLSFDQLNTLAQVISKMLTDDYSYYLVKAHGQLPLTMSFDSWKESYIPHSGHLYPFHYNFETWSQSVR